MASKVLYACDQQFGAAYKALGVPAPVREVVHGVSPIGYEKQIPALLPPVAIPLWSTLSGVVICEWRHWFNERKPVIVRFYPESGLAVEWARSYEQFGYLILQNVLESQAELSPEVEEVAGHLGIADLNAVFAMWEKLGDHSSAFVTHESFVEDLPQSCFDEDMSGYRGDFPVFTATAGAPLDSTCSFEVHRRFSAGMPVLDVRDRVRGTEDAPPWLTPAPTSARCSTRCSQMATWRAPG